MYIEINITFVSPSPNLSFAQLSIVAKSHATNVFVAPVNMATQTRSIPQSSWDQHRENILKLYLTDDLSIANLAKAMQEGHGFSATYGHFSQCLSTVSDLIHAVFHNLRPSSDPGAPART